MSARPALALTLLALAAPAGAEPRAFAVAPAGKAPGSSVSATVAYSLGAHVQEAREVRGTVRLDDATLTSVSGVVTVPIAALHGDGGTRDCHQRESLGLDYARSRFPGVHVCADDRLPDTGPDAVAFPDVRLELVAARPLDDVALLATGAPVRVQVDVRWTVHGITRDATELVRVVRTAPGLRVRGRSTLVLKDFGVVVKSVKVLFAEISVADAVTVAFDLGLAPAPPG